MTPLSWTKCTPTNIGTVPMQVTENNDQLSHTRPCCIVHKIKQLVEQLDHLEILLESHVDSLTKMPCSLKMKASESETLHNN